MIGASAAVVCLGGVVTGCTGGSHGGYAAVGPAGASGAARGGPAGGVTFVPLDGRAGGGDGTGAPPGSGTPGGTGPGPGTTTGPTSPGSGERSGNPGSPGDAGTPATGAPSAPDARHGRTTAPAPVSTPPPPTGAASPAPAALTWTGPRLADGAHRWCDEVTLGFRNSGGSPVRSGTVTFGTHIVDALGIDWSTVRSTQDLPVPIGAGTGTSKTWTVCVESWRVPLGMHVETRDVSVQWD